MKIAIITTGDEIMSGNVVDTNFSWISDRSWMLGYDVVWHCAVADKPDHIGDACHLASQKADIVFVSGGLGATVDDITVESVAKAFGKQMIFHEDIWKEIQAFFARAGRECSENNKRQAYIPEGGKPLVNRIGTAPGVQVKFGQAIFFFLPGVPRELYQIFDDSIMPWMREHSKGMKYSQRFLKCFGLPEASFDERLKGLDLGNVRLSFRVSFPEVKIKLVCREGDEKLLHKTEEDIRQRIGDYIYGIDNDTLEGVVGNLLKNKGLRLAVVESCTGGHVADLITNVPGASHWFERGFITYSNEAKEEALGVNPATIKKYGAVSEECAIEMAQCVMKISKADLGLSITGIAGPTGATPDKPLGSVHIALASGDKTVHVHYVEPRPREQFKMLVAYQALDVVRRSFAGKSQL